MKQFTLIREDLGSPHKGLDFVLGFECWVGIEFVGEDQGVAYRTGGNRTIKVLLASKGGRGRAVT